MSSPAKPISIRGVAYPSRRAAALALGLTPTAISTAIRHGRVDAVGLPVAGAGIRVTVGGEPYRSVAAAARALGLHRSKIEWVRA